MKTKTLLDLAARLSEIISENRDRFSAEEIQDLKLTIALLESLGEENSGKSKILETSLQSLNLIVNVMRLLFGSDFTPPH